MILEIATSVTAVVATQSATRIGPAATADGVAIAMVTIAAVTIVSRAAGGGGRGSRS